MLQLTGIREGLWADEKTSEKLISPVLFLLTADYTIQDS